MFCTNCGKEIADGSLFCTSCGTKMTQEPAGQPGTEQPINADDSLQAGTDNPQATPTVDPVSTPNTPKKSNTGIVVIIAAVVVIALAFLLFSGGGGYKDYKDLAAKYYEAVYNEDVNAMIKLFDKDAQEYLKEDKDIIEEELEEIKDDLNDRYGRGWNRKIDAGTRARGSDRDTYYVPIDIDDDFHENLYIKRDGDKYYIHEDYIDF